MCRPLTLALVPAMLIVTWDEAHAERYLGFSQTSRGMTYYIGAQTVGGQNITTILGPVTLQYGETATLLRDRLMPEVGIPNVGKRSAYGGQEAGIRVFHGDNVQFWVSVDQTNWQLINYQTKLMNDDLYFTDFGSNGTTAAVAAGGVPAVGGVGLAVLVAILLGVGAFIIVKRRQASTA
jgi:hypothetical protein